MDAGFEDVAFPRLLRKLFGGTLALRVDFAAGLGVPEFAYGVFEGFIHEITADKPISKPILGRNEPKRSQNEPNFIEVVLAGQLPWNVLFSLVRRVREIGFVREIRDFLT